MATPNQPPLPSLSPSQDDVSWLVELINRWVSANMRKPSVTADQLDRAYLLRRWLHAAQPDEALSRFLARLAMASEDRNADVFELPAPVMGEIAGRATLMANQWAANDPMLGNGRDTRAVYALALGLSTGAGIMCSVITTPPQE